MSKRLFELSNRAAIAGVGTSHFGRNLPDTPLKLAAIAFKNALDDAGLSRDDVDGLAINLGWPLGVEYSWWSCADRVCSSGAETVKDPRA